MLRDMTLPSAPDQSQVPMLNKIYEYGLPVSERIPHRRGKNVRVGGKYPQLPLIFTGPLVFNWTEWAERMLLPRLDDGALAGNQQMNMDRFNRWASANITVEGRPEWIFIKLYCHSFFDRDQQACIGDKALRFFSEIIERGQKSSSYKVYFAGAREACNMVLAAVDGQRGEPGDFRDYRLKAIMNENKKETL